MINKIKNIINSKNNKNKIKKVFEKINKKNIILMGAPEYENLGDHAIAYATEMFFKKYCPKYNFISINENDILYNFHLLKKMINSNDILLLQGGGNMGDIYFDQRRIRKKVITGFKDNQIIIMPQTIHFKKEKKLPKYYNSHKKLTILAREEISYKMLKEIYSGRVELTPDIVLSLMLDYKVEKRKVRNNALLCIRDDIESIGNTDEIMGIVKKELENNKINYELFSTVLKYPIEEQNREKELKKLFEKINDAKIIITDRLHGMIIAAITKTPCIVLPTFNHKVKSSYNWIRKLNYIKLCENSEKIKENINILLNLKEGEMTSINLEKEFRKIIEIVEEE